MSTFLMQGYFALSLVKRSRRRIEATGRVGGFSIIAFCVLIVPGARRALNVIDGALAPLMARLFAWRPVRG